MRKRVAWVLLYCTTCILLRTIRVITRTEVLICRAIVALCVVYRCRSSESDNPMLMRRKISTDKDNLVATVQPGHFRKFQINCIWSLSWSLHLPQNVPCTHSPTTPSFDQVICSPCFSLGSHGVMYSLPTEAAYQ